MRPRTTILLLTLAGTLGCAAFPAKRTPKLDRPRVAPELRGNPTIRLVVNDHTSQSKKTTKSLERARKKFPYLAAATERTADPDYNVELSVVHNSYENDINGLAYYSMAVIPAIGTEELTVSATVTGADGRTLGSVASTGRSKWVIQMHLLWVLPIAGPLMPHVDRKMWTNSFRDVFIQAAELIAEDQINAARVPSSSTEDHGETGPADRRRG